MILIFDLRPSSVLSFYVASSPRAKVASDSLRSTPNFASKASSMNTPPIKNGWSRRWIVERIPDVLDNGSSRVLRATYVCGPRISVYIKEWRGRIAPSTRIEFSARYRNRRLKCSARVLGLEQPRTKLSRCVFAPPYHARAIDPGFVFGFPSFVFRSSSAAFDSAGREKRLPVILLQRQSFAAQRDFTFPPKLRMELVAIGNDHNKFREMGGKKCSP